MWPRVGASALVPRWIALTLIASLVAAVDGGWLDRWLALAPAAVWRGQVWRLVTWPLIEGSPWQLVFTCASIYKLGGDLAIRWGDRRLRRFVLEVVVAAGVVTCVIAPLAGVPWLARSGGWAVGDLLVIAWARQFPSESLRIHQMLVLRGRQLVMVTLGVTLVFAIYFGPVAMMPEVVACAAAAAYPRGWLARR